MTGARIDYNNRFFSADPGGSPETAAAGESPVGHYHQLGDLVWAEFRGGKVLTGRLVGTCGPDGALRLAYCQVLSDGGVVAGECTSKPERLPDGRLRLREEWRRSDGSSGVSHIEEVRGRTGG
ncbi:hypothetical protein ACFXDE_25310 [Kitasatospora sp. NPDC059408]|uniref:hypothetical protein n=1 Tax=Kitasatospora sp. NPDC059408 TaxID=3346823 RepID=UPI0036850FE2